MQVMPNKVLIDTVQCTRVRCTRLAMLLSALDAKVFNARIRPAKGESEEYHAVAQLLKPLTARAGGFCVYMFVSTLSKGSCYATHVFTRIQDKHLPILTILWEPCACMHSTAADFEYATRLQLQGDLEDGASPSTDHIRGDLELALQTQADDFRALQAMADRDAAYARHISLQDRLDTNLRDELCALDHAFALRLRAKM